MNKNYLDKMEEITLSIPNRLCPHCECIVDAEMVYEENEEGFEKVLRFLDSGKYHEFPNVCDQCNKKLDSYPITIDKNEKCDKCGKETTYFFCSIECTKNFILKNNEREKDNLDRRNDLKKFKK